VRTVIRADTVPEFEWPAPPNCLRYSDFVFISGQVAWDKDRNVIGPNDAYVQARVVFENIRALMEASGGDVSDEASITMFTVDMRHQPGIWKARAEVFGKTIPTSTLLCVHSLFVPGLLVEVQAVGCLRRKGGAV
jgi:enamine deaminase RidA (YjgF/YER057c/UK114 family)